MEKQANNSENFTKQMQQGRKKGVESSKHQRASLSSLKMLFILLKGLLTSLGFFSEVSLGADFLHGASVQPVSSQGAALLMSASLTPSLR